MLVLDSSWGLWWSKRDDGTDEPSVVLDKSVKLEDTREFAHKEAEEMEAMSPECFGVGFCTCAVENKMGLCF